MVNSTDYSSDLYVDLGNKVKIRSGFSETEGRYDRNILYDLMELGFKPVPDSAGKPTYGSWTIFRKT